MPNKFVDVLGQDVSNGVSRQTPRGNRSGAVRRDASEADRRSSPLPGWSELEAPENKRVGQFRRRREGLATWPTARMLLWLVGLGTLLTLYVGHVHATKNMLAQVHELRQENLQLHLKYNRLRGELQESIGPATVYERARRLGLKEGESYGPTIYIEQ